MFASFVEVLCDFFHDENDALDGRVSSEDPEVSYESPSELRA